MDVTNQTFLNFIQSGIISKFDMTISESYDLARTWAETPLWQTLFAIAYHETGAFDSNLYKQYNNAAGLHYADWERASGYIYADGGKVATYMHPGDSIADLFDLVIMHYGCSAPGSDAEVREFLECAQQSGFNPNPDWVNRVIRVYGQLATAGVFDVVAEPEGTEMPDEQTGNMSLRQWGVISLSLVVLVWFLRRFLK